MSGGRLEGLQVLVTGIGSLSSRNVVRELLAEQAAVTAADPDDQVLRRLQRDLGLVRASVAVARLDLFGRAEMGRFGDRLRGIGELPHIIVCCCDGDHCPADLAIALLRPGLVLHAPPPAGARSEPAASGLQISSLAGLVAQARRNRGFDTRTCSKMVSIAGHVFGLRSGEAAPDPTPRRRDAPAPDRVARTGAHAIRRRPAPEDFAAPPRAAPLRQATREFL